MLKNYVKPYLERLLQEVGGTSGTTDPKKDLPRTETPETQARDGETTKSTGQSRGTEAEDTPIPTPPGQGSGAVGDETIPVPPSGSQPGGSNATQDWINNANAKMGGGLDANTAEELRVGLLFRSGEIDRLPDQEKARALNQLQALAQRSADGTSKGIMLGNTFSVSNENGQYHAGMLHQAGGNSTFTDDQHRFKVSDGKGGYNTFQIKENGDVVPYGADGDENTTPVNDGNGSGVTPVTESESSVDGQLTQQILQQSAEALGLDQSELLEMALQNLGDGEGFATSEDFSGVTARRDGNGNIFFTSGDKTVNPQEPGAEYDLTLQTDSTGKEFIARQTKLSDEQAQAVEEGKFETPRVLNALAEIHLDLESTGTKLNTYLSTLADEGLSTKEGDLEFRRVEDGVYFRANDRDNYWTKLGDPRSSFTLNQDAQGFSEVNPTDLVGP